MKENKTDWSEWIYIAALWYVPAGLILLLSHKEPEISTLGWFGIYLASPVIVAGGIAVIGVVVLAVCLPIYWIWHKLKLSDQINRYEMFLGQIQSKSENAARKGNKWEARKLKVLYWLLAIPIIIIAYLIASSAAGRYD
jgi:hypothetical protein